jgi:hypothetical protein
MPIASAFRLCKPAESARPVTFYLESIRADSCRRPMTLLKLDRTAEAEKPLKLSLAFGVISHSLGLASRCSTTVSALVLTYCCSLWRHKAAKPVPKNFRKNYMSVKITGTYHQKHPHLFVMYTLQPPALKRREC